MAEIQTHLVTAGFLGIAEPTQLSHHMLTFWFFGPTPEYATNRPTVAAQLNIIVFIFVGYHCNSRY